MSIDVLKKQIEKEIRDCLESSEVARPLSLDDLKKNIEEATNNLVDRVTIPKPVNFDNVQVRLASVPVYKITYKTQLNSIHFITSKEEIKTHLFKGSNILEEAIQEAPNHVSKGAQIISVVLDHFEEDRTKINIQWSYNFHYLLTTYTYEK